MAATMADGEAGWGNRVAITSGSALLDGIVATTLARRSLLGGIFVATMTSRNLRRHFVASILGPRRLRLAALARERRGR